LGLLAQRIRSLDSGLRLKWRQGPTALGWQEISLQAASQLRKWRQDSLADAFVKLWFEEGSKRKTSEFARNVEKLIRFNDDFFDERGPRSEEDYETATHDLRNIIIGCMGALSFLCSHPIYRIRRVRRVPGQSSAKIKAICCMGDRAFPRELDFPRGFPELLAEDGLYIRIAEQE